MSRTRSRRGPSSAPECLFIYGKIVRAERRLNSLQVLLNERVGVLPPEQMQEYVDGSSKIEAQEDARNA
jgi:hypothetical protein